MGVEPFLLAATINLGIAQRLARKICTNCKEPQEIEASTVEKLKKDLAKIPPKFFKPGFDPNGKLVFYHGKGCPRCGGTGYQGRVAIAELFEYVEPVRRLIEKSAETDQLRVEFTKQGAITMRQDSVLKALDGLTTVEEVFRLSQDVQEDA